MKLFRSPSDAFTWSILMLVFIGAFISIALNFHIIRQLQSQQQQYHADTKVYISCLLKIDSKGNIKSQEQVCFNQN